MPLQYLSKIGSTSPQKTTVAVAKTHTHFHCIYRIQNPPTQIRILLNKSRSFHVIHWRQVPRITPLLDQQFLIHRPHHFTVLNLLQMSNLGCEETIRCLDETFVKVWKPSVELSFDRFMFDHLADVVDLSSIAASLDRSIDLHDTLHLFEGYRCITFGISGFHVIFPLRSDYWCSLLLLVDVIGSSR